jgi:hypothetical protein
MIWIIRLLMLELTVSEQGWPVVYLPFPRFRLLVSVTSCSSLAVAVWYLKLRLYTTYTLTLLQ